MQWFVIIVVLAMTACSSGTGPGDDSGSPRLLWKTETPSAAWMDAATDGEIAVIANSSTVHAFEARSGDRRWARTVALPSGIGKRSFPTNGALRIHGDLVLVPAWDLVALDRGSGNVRWRYAPSDDFPGVGVLAVGGDRVYTVGRKIHAVDVQDGTAIWTVDLGERPFGPVLAGGVLYVGTRGRIDGSSTLGAGHVMALDPADGGVLWKFPVPDAPAPETYLGGVASPPAVVGDLVLAAGMNARLYALDRETGEMQWIHVAEEPLPAGVVAIDDVAITAGDARVAEGVDLETGERVWTAHVGSSVSRVVGGGGAAFVANSDLLAIRPDGSVVRLGAQFGLGATAAPAFHDGLLFGGGLRFLWGAEVGSF